MVLALRRGICRGAWQRVPNHRRAFSSEERTRPQPLHLWLTGLQGSAPARLLMPVDAPGLPNATTPDDVVRLIDEHYSLDADNATQVLYRAMLEALCGALCVAGVGASCRAICGEVAGARGQWAQCVGQWVGRWVHSVVRVGQYVGPQGMEQWVLRDGEHRVVGSGCGAVWVRPCDTSVVGSTFVSASCRTTPLPPTPVTRPQGRRNRRPPPFSDWTKLGFAPSANPQFSLAPSAPLKTQHHWGGGVSRSPDGLFAQPEREPIRGRPAVRGKRTYGGRPGQRVEGQGTWAAQKHSEAGYGRPVDRGVWTATTVKRPRQQPAHPQYANYWAPLTRKWHTIPHSAQPQHTNYWAPRTRKRQQQEHQPQRPTESSDPTQHAKGRTGDRPGPRKGATTRRNVTQGGAGAQALAQKPAAVLGMFPARGQPGAGHRRDQLSRPARVLRIGLTLVASARFCMSKPAGVMAATATGGLQRGCHTTGRGAERRLMPYGSVMS